jgi:hypothetical protein
MRVLMSFLLALSSVSFANAQIVNWADSPNNWANSPNNWANSPNNWANNPANSNAQNSVLNNNGERIGYETISPQGVRNIYYNNGQRLGYTPARPNR